LTVVGRIWFVVFFDTEMISYPWIYILFENLEGKK